MDNHREFVFGKGHIKIEGKMRGIISIVLDIQLDVLGAGGGRLLARGAEAVIGLSLNFVGQNLNTGTMQKLLALRRNGVPRVGCDVWGLSR